MQIITVAIQKGGTGKTTTAAALAQAAAFRNKKILAIDTDPQGNFSFTLGADHRHKGTYELLQGVPVKECLQSINGIDIIAAGWNLSTLATSSKGSARRLQNALEPVKEEYDLIIIDTPPTAGELQYNALQAATELIIPLQADIYNLQAVLQIVNAAVQIMRTNKDLRIAGYVLTQYDQRSTLAKQMQQTIQSKTAEMGIKCLGTIRNAVAVKEAAALQQSLFTYAPKSKPAQDYLQLFDSLEI